MMISLPSFAILATAIATLVQGQTSCTIDSSYTSITVSAGSSQTVQITVPVGKYFSLSSFNYGSQTTDKIQATSLVCTNDLTSTTGPFCFSTAFGNCAVTAGTSQIYTLTCSNWVYDCHFLYRINGNFYSTGSTAPPTTSTSSQSPSPSPSSAAAATQIATAGNYDRTGYSCTGYVPTTCELKCRSGYSVSNYGSGTIFLSPTYTGSDCTCSSITFMNGVSSDGTTLVTYSSTLDVETSACTFYYMHWDNYDYYNYAVTYICLGVTLPGVGLGLIAPAVDLCIQGKRGRSQKTLALTYIGNFFWLVLGGWWLFFMYVIVALIVALTIVLVPFSIKILHLAVLVLLPFGRKLEDDMLDTKQQQVSCIANVVWIVVGGVFICVLHLIMAITYMLSLIGIPIGMKHLELAKNGLLPFGKTVRISETEINICGDKNHDEVRATQLRPTATSTA